MKIPFADVFPSVGPSSGAPRHTLFFGLLPPEDIAHQVFGVADSLSRSGRVSGCLRPERVLHVSLLLVGKALDEPPPAALIATLRARAERVKQRPFTVSLNRLEAWGRSGASRPVVALGDEGVFGVEALHRNLAEALGVAERPQFNPHMTLLYGTGPPEPLAIPPIAWSVRDFVLVHSLAGLTRYEVLARFRLSA